MCVARGSASCWAVMDRSSSAEGGVGGAAFGDLGFEPVPDCQQLLLVDDVLAAVLEVVFEHVGLDDRIHRTGFLPEPAEDALEQVDVVARGAAGTVCTLLRNGGDRQRRADRDRKSTRLNSSH